MPETCLKKFKVAVEVANFICYVKYVDQSKDDLVPNLAEALYGLVKQKSDLKKEDIAELINLHTHQLTPGMLKERKFSLPYNPINDQYLKNNEEINDSYDTPFVIKMSHSIEKQFDKDTFMNHFTDMYHDSLFLIDIRYYGIEKKYYDVDFEICLSEKELLIKSSDNHLVNSLLAQYDIKQIVDTLDLYQEPETINILSYDNLSNMIIEGVYKFDSKSVLEQLVECYEASPCLFINNVFLKTLNINIDDLLTPGESPKLLIVLEKRDYNYFNQQKTNTVNRIEKIGNNTILYIDEHLFREAIGNMAYILMMNEKNHVTLNKLGVEFNGYPYLAKVQNRDLRFFQNILEKYFEIKKLDSYMDNLLLLTFVYDQELINSNLNYYLVNTLRSNTSILHFNVESRESLPFTDLVKLIDVYHLAEQLNKKIELNPNNIKLLLDDMTNMIRKVDSIKKLTDFYVIMQEVLVVFNIDETTYENEVTKIKTLLDIKKTIFEKDKDISFILDTSVLIDEPDIFHKYFNNNKIVVHSIIQDELECFRGNNINAVRAIRNINYLRNNPGAHLQFIRGEKVNTVFTKPIKIKIFENLINQLNSEGKYPVLVSNDDNLVLYEKNKDNIIELKHLPLLFK